KRPDRGGRGGVVLGVPLDDAFVGFRNLRVVDVFEQQVVGLGVVGLDVRPRPGLTRIFLPVCNLVQLTDDIVSALVTHVLAFRSRTSRTSGISAAIVAITVSPCLTSMAVSLSATMVCSGYQTLPASRMARLTSPFRFDPVTVSTQTASRPCG